MFAEYCIVRSGRWLTKRRSVLLAPLFTAALLSARMAPSVPWELAQDLLGVCCLAGGTWLRLLAASYHDSSHHAEPITAGPYAWVRHPLYLSNFLLGLGIVLVTGWWPMVAVYVLVFLPLHWVIARSEEVHLAELYGGKYEVYRRAVPAILPWRRFKGPRYGSRSSFKLEKGKEEWKVAGYVAGVLGLLLVKNWRQAVTLPALPPLPLGAGLLAAAMAITAVILRPRVRFKWLRACQTVISVACVLLIVVHVPGVLRTPAPSPAAATAPVVSVPPAGSAALPAELRPAAASRTQESQWPGLIHRVGAFLWNHLDLVGGAVSFGIASLVEEEHEERNGGFKMTTDLGEASQVGLGVAFALGMWKQWHGTSELSESEPGNDPWRLRMRPVAEPDRFSLLATVKRRF